MPSRKTAPWYGSDSRNSATISELFPLPVRPTMPTFSALPTVNDTPCARAACQLSHATLRIRALARHDGSVIRGFKSQTKWTYALWVLQPDSAALQQI